MEKYFDGQEPKLSRAERNRRLEEERSKLQQWLEDHKHNELFQKTVREFNERQGGKVKYDPNDDESLYRVLMAPPDYKKMYEAAGLKMPPLLYSNKLHWILYGSLGMVLVCITLVFYLIAKDAASRPSPPKNQPVMRIR